MTTRVGSYAARDGTHGEFIDCPTHGSLHFPEGSITDENFIDLNEEHERCPDQ